MFDRFGTPLALTVSLQSATADPVLVTNPNVEASRLSPILHIAEPVLHQLLISPDQFVYLKRLLPDSASKKIQKMIDQGSLPGIKLITEQTRLDPQAPLASSVIGETNSFGGGISGLEYQYNDILKGTPGSETYTVTANGSRVPDGTISYVPPRSGSTLNLTIDSTLQYYTEKALAGQIQASHAIGGTAIVMDVRTGQILTMANLTANPLPSAGAPPNVPTAVPVDSPRSFPSESWTNDAIAAVYEPGSVAKIATFTAALEHHVITPSSVFQVPDQLMIDGTLFHDAETHPTQAMTPAEILGQSSNIGTIMVAKKLGKYAITKSFERYGWGEPTGLNFPGESVGYLRKVSQWSGTAIGSVPIGQDEAVTPLQVLDSYNAIANRGVMVTPKLVLSVDRPNGTKVTPASPKPRRIEKASIAATMTSLLTHAVAANGTAPAAAIPGYTIAGKTGTSQKPWPNRAGYQPGAFWATFVGFVPAQHPVLSAIVMLNQPTPIYGGSVAAPVFSKIMTFALQRYGIRPNGSIVGVSLPRPSTKIRQQTGRSSVPPVVSLRSGARWFPVPR
jgi:cell division protein FtsI/penicillin-binding protein 2